MLAGHPASATRIIAERTFFGGFRSDVLSGLLEELGFRGLQATMGIQHKVVVDFCRSTRDYLCALVVVPASAGMLR